MDIDDTLDEFGNRVDQVKSKFMLEGENVKGSLS